MGFLDTVAVWLNFFDIKTRHYPLMRYATKRFDLNELFLWKFFCGSIILTFAVVVPCMWIPWEGFTFDGREKPPPIFHFAVCSGLLSSISMFVATFNLFRALDRSRFVVRRRIRAMSWEMVDWVLYEVSTTAGVVSMIVFWLVQVPTAETQVHLLRIEGVLVQFVVMSVDFYFTTPHFRKSHIFLVLLWPSFWIMLQFVWIIAGHQPTSEAVDFHTWRAPFIAVALLLATIGSFFLMKHIARRLRVQPAQDDISKAAFMTQEESEIDSSPHRSTRSSVISSTLANFELMAKSQRAKGSPVRQSNASSNDMESGVFRLGSDVSNRSDSHRVIAMGSWVGDLPHKHHT